MAVGWEGTGYGGVAAEGGEAAWVGVHDHLYYHGVTMRRWNHKEKDVKVTFIRSNRLRFEIWRKGTSKGTSRGALQVIQT